MIRSSIDDRSDNSKPTRPLIYRSKSSGAVWLIPLNSDNGVCIAAGSHYKVGDVFQYITYHIGGVLTPFAGEIVLEIEV